MNNDIFDLEEKLSSSDRDVVATTMLYISHNISENPWTQEKLISLLGNRDADIRGLALTCLGHVARISGKINSDLVFPVLKKMLLDESLGGRAQDALDDIEMFVKK
ncbi:hypothetical protein LL967_07815 [Xanthomonas campestris pv. zinniae]|nr:hypothetical protein [Xanthomonas campestris pv. zinniae]